MLTGKENFEQALKAMDSGKFNLSIDLFSKCIHLGYEPLNLIYHKRAIAYLEIQKEQLALDDLSNAIKLNENDDYAYYNKGAIFFNLEDFESAFKELSSSIELGTKISDAYLLRAHIYFFYYKINKEAMDDCSKVESNNTNFNYYNLKGLIYYDEKKYDKAIESFNTAIELSPAHAPLYSNRGLVFNEKEEYSQALQDYNQAIKLDKNFPESYNNRGFTYFKVGYYKKSVDDFTQAIVLNPSYAMAYFNRANSLIEMLKYESAIKDYDKVVELGKANWKVFNNRGLAFSSLHQYKNAIKDFTKSIEINPEDVNAYTNRGIEYANLGFTEKAFEDFDLAISKNKDFALTYYNRGVTNINLNAKHKAYSDFVRYIHLADEREVTINFFSLITFFKEETNAPYVAKKLIQKTNEFSHLLSYQLFIEQTLIQCEVIDAYLIKIGVLDELEQKMPHQYSSIKAFINFFMGTVGVTYEIFNKISKNNSFDILTLREAYYYLLSADEFFIQNSDIKVKALIKAKKCFIDFSLESDDVTRHSELYYAGLLFLYLNEVKKAYDCFNIISLVFLPAAYMKTLTLQSLGMQNEMQKEIELIRDWELSYQEPALLNGFSLIELSLNYYESLESIHYFMYYWETMRAIELVRKPNDRPFRAPTFWEAFTLSEQVITDIHSSLFQHILKLNENQYYIKIKIPDESKIRWKLYQAEKDFEELKNLSFNEGDIENKISELIYISDLEAKNYEYFIFYFFNQKKIGIMAVYSLLHYLKFITILNKSTSDTLVKGSEKWIEEIGKAVATGAFTGLLDWRNIFVSIPLNVTLAIFSKIYGKQIIIWLSEASPNEDFKHYSYIKKKTINALYEIVKKSENSKEIAFEKYILPELNKWSFKIDH